MPEQKLDARRVRQMATACAWNPRETAAVLRIVRDDGDIPDSDRPHLGTALAKAFKIAQEVQRAKPANTPGRMESIDVPLDGRRNGIKPGYRRA